MKYDNILPALMNMLKSPKITSEVYELLFNLLKTLISKSINGLEEKRDLFYIGSKKKK